MMRSRAILISIAASMAGASVASAIVIRHDRSDADHRAMGAGFDDVGQVSGDGVCTLIAPDWVITAAHVAEGMSPFNRTVSIAGERRPIALVVLHPSWKGRPGQSSIDMALIKLEAPVDGVRPAGLYEKSDELGQTVLFVGNGDFGNGRDGPLGSDKRWRAARNIVTDVAPGRVQFVFDRPDAALTDEGISGPGDSGGPAFLEQGGKRFIVGVSSTNSGGDGPCRYDSVETYARVSTELDWITETMREPPAGAAAGGGVLDLAVDPWPDTRAAEIAQAFLKHYASDTMLEFERAFRPDGRPAEERAAQWASMRERWGELTALRCVSDGDKSLWVELQRTTAERPLVVRFVVQPSSEQFRGLMIRD